MVVDLSGLWGDSVGMRGRGRTKEENTVGHDFRGMREEDMCISNDCIARGYGLYVCSRAFRFIDFGATRAMDEVYSVEG